MTWAYDSGREHALQVLGLTKTAAPGGLRVRAPRDPFQDVQRKLSRAFKLKTPEFDISKLLKRLLTNPFKQPQRQLSGLMPGLRT